MRVKQVRINKYENYKLVTIKSKDGLSWYSDKHPQWCLKEEDDMFAIYDMRDNKDSFFQYSESLEHALRIAYFEIG